MLVCDSKGGDRRHLSGCLHEPAEDPAPRHGVHRAAQGVLGTGHFLVVMFEEMEAFARGRGVMQLELAYAQGNDRARRLYDRHGLCGDGPGALTPSACGTARWLDEIFMVKKL